MSALVVLPSELSVPASLLPPRPGASLEEWNAYRKAARAAGCYRAAKAEAKSARAFPTKQKEIIAPKPGDNAGPVRDWLFVSTPPKHITSRDVMRVVSQVTGVSVEDILSDSRVKTVARARHMCFALMTRYCRRLSGLQIARLMRKDHTCGINSRRRVKELLEANAEFADMYESADSILGTMSVLAAWAGAGN